MPPLAVLCVSVCLVFTAAIFAEIIPHILQLVSGCMRMRKLGEGHIIRFWGSNEVHPQIVKCAENGRAPGSYAVLKWTLQNSVNFMEENFIYWAGSGIYELQKQSAENICDANESKLLAQLYSQNEVLELMSMYGLEKTVLKYPCIANNMISLMVAHLRSFARDSPNFRENEIRQNSEFILKHLEKYVGQLERTSNVLDEEQERELDPEKETEAEIEPPSKATAEKHQLNRRLREFIITGNKSSFCPTDLLPLQEAFSNCNLQQYCNAVSWGNGPKFIVNATRDFERTVIQSLQQKSDDFLRPVMWIYNTVSEGLNFAILLSPFEVNDLWNELKTGTGTLRIYGPQLFVDQKVLHESVPVMVPSRTESHAIFPAAMTASLDILAGTIYFTDEATERIYCCVAGISPKPRQSEEEILFHSGGIVNCFIDPKLRNSLPMFNEMSVFQEHPERLIRGIIEARHGTFSDKSHVGNVVVNGRKNFIK